MGCPTRNDKWSIQQQLIDDDVSGLTFAFDVLPSGEPVLRIYGAILPHGNRILRFSQSGNLEHLATSVLGTERPNWPRENKHRANALSKELKNLIESQFPQQSAPCHS